MKRIIFLFLGLMASAIIFAQQPQQISDDFQIKKSSPRYYFNSNWLGTTGNTGSTLLWNGTEVAIGDPMVYPAAGIPLSTGAAWGASITNNSANWNTAYGWGNHSVAGYAPLASPTFTGTVTLPALKVTTGAAAGNMLYSDADGDLTYLGAGGTDEILVGGGAAVPVWTTATGTGAPVRGTSPTIGGTLSMDNGATIINTDADNLDIVEKNVNITGDFDVSGTITAASADIADAVTFEDALFANTKVTNILDYDALGDGSDDQPEIQAAITAGAGGINGYLIKYCDGGFNKDLKIHDNTLTKAAYNGSGDYDFSIELWDCRGGVEIYDNILSAGIDIGGYITEKGVYPYAAYIHNNTIGPDALSTLDGTRGIIVEGEWQGYIDIRYNHIKNVARGISLQSSFAGKTMTDVNIDYNIIENIGLANGGADYKGWGIDWMEPLVSTDQTVDNINIRNNVITSAETDASSMWGIALPGVGACSNIRIQNNIVMNFDYAPVFGTDWNDGSVTLDYLYIENNVFYGNGNSNLPRYGGSPLAPTHNTTQNNLIVDPEFVGGGDYSLQATSDAIDAGLDVGLTRDYLGKVVGSSPDIGAYEYGASFPHVPITSGGKVVTYGGKIVTK